MSFLLSLGAGERFRVMVGFKLSASGDGVNFEDLTDAVEIPQLKEYLLKWIPNSNPDRIGYYQLVDMDTEQVVIEGNAELITEYIKSSGLVSSDGWVWVGG